MYTSLEYVIVHKVDIYELNRFGSNWRTQTLVFKLPGDKKRLFSYHVTNKIDISHLKKGDRIKLNLHVFGKGRSTFFKPEFCVNGVLLLE
ncbi:MULTISPECIES: hypothetical protein [Enterococcus]|uniref:hypothetical protein n=1 Tax=Enterococcus TaxID=1350 RepID=UPI0023044B16|nr:MULTISPECIES: hypothetical protein [Enterococcus]